ncbi:MAG: Spy/CpxP family protein refolding chaperone [Paramuribaculum sp.]|nr:Spy/CpxP family protein refolding chaperone [Paramuribaculum sp.]
MMIQKIFSRLMASIIVAVAAIFMSASLNASPHPQGKGKKERTEWMKEMRRYKAEFVADRLKLTDEQKAKFVPAYEEMDERTAKIERETRQMEREVRKKGAQATDTEYEKAAEALTELKGKQGAIEMEYLPKFKSILTKEQLFKMKGAERDFMRELMDRHRKSSKK